MAKSVRVECRSRPAADWGSETAVVVVDVVRSATTAVTASAMGHPCFPVPSLDAAVRAATRLAGSLLVGELGGSTPYGFDLNNSPAAVAGLADHDRPIVLLSTSGTRLMCQCARRYDVYLGCLRGPSALVRHLSGRYERVLLVGAPTRGEFREEDQLCCARLTEGLEEAGFEPSPGARRVVDRWRGSPTDAFVGGASAKYLEASGQTRDLEFILDHVDDLPDVFVLRRGRVVPVPPDVPPDAPPDARRSGVG